MLPDNPILETIQEIEEDVVDAAKAVAAEVKAVAAEIADAVSGGTAALASHCAETADEDPKTTKGAADPGHKPADDRS